MSFFFSSFFHFSLFVYFSFPHFLLFFVFFFLYFSLLYFFSHFFHPFIYFFSFFFYFFPFIYLFFLFLSFFLSFTFSFFFPFIYFPSPLVLPPLFLQIPFIFFSFHTSIYLFLSLHFPSLAPLGSSPLIPSPHHYSLPPHTQPTAAPLGYHLVPGALWGFLLPVGMRAVSFEPQNANFRANTFGRTMMLRCASV